MLPSHLIVEIENIFTINGESEMSRRDYTGMNRSHLYFRQSLPFHLGELIWRFMSHHRFSQFSFWEIIIGICVQSENVIFCIFSWLAIEIIDFILIHKCIVVDIGDLWQGLLI